MSGKLYSEDEYKAAIAAAVAEASAASAVGDQDAISAAVKAEGARISGIMGLPEYKGREALAQKFIDKGMSVADAKEFLASASVETSTINATAVVDKTAQVKVLEQLASEIADVQPDANAGKPTASAKGVDAEAVATVKAIAAARFAR
jgi:hypothetical protein